MTIYSASENETQNAGAKLAKTLRPGSVLALYGDLGAGKTAFVRGLAEGLGVRIRATSPTFTIVNEYPGDVPLFHFDMYRLCGADELFELGWDDYLARGGVVAVEWSENVPGAFPDGTVYVRIEKLSDCERKIKIEGGGI